MTDIVVEREAEESLCGAVLRGGSEVYAQAREVVKPEDFRVEVLGTLWRAFENLHNGGIKIDVFTATDELKRMNCFDKFSSGAWSGTVYLANLRGNGVPANVLSYAENVADYS